MPFLKKKRQTGKVGPVLTSSGGSAPPEPSLSDVMACVPFLPPIGSKLGIWQSALNLGIWECLHRLV